MTSIFAVDFPGHALQLFGPAHLAALTCIVLFNLFLLRYRGASEEVRRTVRWTLALVLWFNEIAWHAWNLAVGRWTIQEMLPLHICSLMVWLGGLMIVTKNYRIYEFSYFIGIAGALQALLTPNVGIYGFPHFWFFQTFISHGLIVTSAIYMTTVEGFRPTWRSILRVVIVLNLYMVPVYFVNSAIGSDYLFVNSKPATASLLDMLPPWPVYILYMEAIGLVMFGLLYLPFWIRDLRARPKVAIA